MATWPCYTTLEWQMQMASYVFQEAACLKSDFQTKKWISFGTENKWRILSRRIGLLIRVVVVV